MKILIGIHYFPPHVGGMEIVAKTQAQKLAAKGHDVTVLTSATGSHTGTHDEDGYTLTRLVVWNFFETHMGVPFPFFGPSLLRRAYAEVKSTDVVHLHDVFYQTSWVLAFWAWVLRKPIVVTQHVDMIPHPNAFVRFVQWAVYKTIGKFVFAASQRVAVLNTNVRNFLLNLGVNEQKILFMPNGVDTSIFYPDSSLDIEAIRTKYNLPLRTPIALFVGRFVPKKGYQKLIEAQSEEYHIAFAGGMKPADLPVSDTLTFLGSLTPKELAELYNAVDMFVLPSEGEGFPLTVQEAMASKLPVVISNNPGYDIYDFDTTLFKLIQPTVAMIRTTLSELAHNDGLRKAMAEYSHTYATERFSWDKNITSLATVYEEVR